jgi:site-specific DNA-methyltransferase (adenine-specific)
MGIDPAEVGPPLVDVSLRWVILFCAIEQLGRYQDAVGDAWIRAGAWVKTNPTPQFTGDRPATWGEGIAIMHRPGRKLWNGGGHPASWHYAINTSKHRVHETQKPTKLMLELVRLFSDPDELVWDPYCGSGTTGVACLRLGRRFLGHEMQPHYAAVAAERLAAEERGLTLQAARAGQMSILDKIGGDA